MSPANYRVTLVQLKADALALAPSTEKIELGLITDEEIYRLAGNLLKVNLSSAPKAEPGIIVHRGDKGWRIAVRAGRLCMHKSTSLFDEYWTVDSPAGLAQLPPFHVGTDTPTPAKTVRSHGGAKPKSGGVVRSVLEVAGLFILGVAVIYAGFRFGLPHRRLSDLPDDVVVLTGDGERSAVFTAVAGTYVTGKKAGESIVTITPDGKVSLGRIGKDGKPSAWQIPDEQARAARKGNVAMVITSFGNIAEAPPDAVSVGLGGYKWRKLMTN